MGYIRQSSAISNDKLLVFLPQAPNLDWISKIKGRYPGLQVEWISSICDNGKLLGAEELPSTYWEGITLLLVDWLPPPARLLSKVRFIQTASAGADMWRGHPIYLNKDIIFCNASGLHSPAIAEWVMGSWLMHQRQVSRYLSEMHKETWETKHANDTKSSRGLRMGILGYGSIGRECARLANAMKMEVYAYTKSERPTPSTRQDNTYLQFCAPGTGDPEGLIPSKWFHGSSKESINNFLAQDLDILVISLPLTKDTEKVISYEQFDRLSKKKTFLINVARGGHVDTHALVAALRKGQIRGAALDVTEPEPLPKGHLLWKAPNVYITPHISWLTIDVWDRAIEILEANLERLSRNEPCVNHMKSRC